MHTWLGEHVQQYIHHVHTVLVPAWLKPKSVGTDMMYILVLYMPLVHRCNSATCRPFVPFPSPSLSFFAAIVYVRDRWSLARELYNVLSQAQ
jgi:hypothetical protein